MAALELLTDDQRRSISHDLRREMFRGSFTSRSRAEADLPWREWMSTAAALQAAVSAAELVRAAGRLADLPVAIRGWNIAVGVVTGVVALIGMHSWNSAHSPRPFTPVLSPPAAFSGPTRDPVSGIGAGITVSPLPFPLPTLGLPKLRLVTSVIVRPGDSLSVLACRYQTTVRALQEMNHLGASTLIAVGQRLLVPVTFGVIGTC